MGRWRCGRWTCNRGIVLLFPTENLYLSYHLHVRTVGTCDNSLVLAIFISGYSVAIVVKLSIPILTFQNCRKHVVKPTILLLEPGTPFYQDDMSSHMLRALGLIGSVIKTTTPKDASLKITSSIPSSMLITGPDFAQKKHTAL